MSAVGIIAEVVRKYVKIQGKEEMGKVQLEFEYYHGCTAVLIYGAAFHSKYLLTARWNNAQSPFFPTCCQFAYK